MNNISKFIFLLLILFVYSLRSECKTTEKINVEVYTGNISRINTIASVDLSEYTFPHNSAFRVRDSQTGLFCVNQFLMNGEQTILFWRIDGDINDNERRLFEISTVSSVYNEESPAMQINMDEKGNPVLLMDNDSVLRYNMETKRLPQGIDPAYERNGYIHPVWSPTGSIVTQINPTEHPHHYGIWNPWTSIMYDDKKYDLWNIGDKTGTVRSVNMYYNNGNLFADITAIHEHVIFKQYLPREELVIMHEEQLIRGWNQREDMFVWDLNFDLFPTTDLPVLLKAHRYAGLGYRATADWVKENCEMLTSEKKTRPDIDGTQARWIYITGDNSTGKSGILFLTSPENHNFPEPLRVWDATMNNGKGDVMLNIAPTKYEDWQLEPGEQYPFKYRIITFDGDMSYEEADRIWQDFANPVTVNIVR